MIDEIAAFIYVLLSLLFCQVLIIFGASPVAFSLASASGVGA